MIYDTICLYVCCTTRAQFLREKNAPLDHPDFVWGGGGLKPTALFGAFPCGGLGMPSRWEWGLSSYNIKTLAVDHIR